jgi:hypothetical protein
MDCNSFEDKSIKVKAVENFSYNQVLFPSGPDYYRVKCQYVEEKWVIWCESKRSRQQWEGTFNEQSDIRPLNVQIPMEVIIFSAIANQDAGKDSGSASTAADVSTRSKCIIDLIKGDDNDMELQLTVQLVPFWNPHFLFRLTEIQLKNEDLLESKIRDAQEEIVRLIRQMKKQQQLSCLALNSTNTVDSYFQWSASSFIANDIFEVEKSIITVRSAGLYSIFVAVPSSSNSRVVATLIVNEKIETGVTQSTSYGSYSSKQPTRGHYIHEVRALNAGSEIKVQCCNVSGNGSVSEAHFFIHQTSSTYLFWRL